MNFNNLLGNNIRTLRELQGMSPEELAERAGLKEGSGHVYELENKGREPSLKTAMRIAEALGVATDDLLKSQVSWKRQGGEFYI